MNTVETWNTGRYYGEHGQRMAASKLEDGRVAFMDMDRQIDGVTKTPFEGTNLRNFVMTEYDHGRYEDFYILKADKAALRQKLINAVQSPSKQ